jgi:exodeoxyribonuclease III
LKIATWNVNGIRARHGQVQAWIERDRPDVVCLQEIKATPDQVPGGVFALEDYWCYWHGGKGYSGVGLHVSKAAAASPPVVTHPAFDFEHRIATTEVDGVTIASVYVPNGGKDFPA